MSRCILSLVITLILLPANLVYAPPAPPSITIPGDTIGLVRTRWIGPWVSATTDKVGSRWVTSVRWFDSEGKVIREVFGGRVDAHAGYILDISNGIEKIYAVNGDWELSLPKKAGASGYITGNSRTFIHQFHSEVDVYVLGKLVNTIGPFQQYVMGDVRLGADGSLAFLAWKDKNAGTAQIVAAGPNGKIAFKTDFEGPAMSPIVAPGCKGVLVTLNLPGNGYDTFVFYNKSGKVSSLKVGPNPNFRAWIPGSCKSVFMTSVGDKYRCQLIDWKTGTVLWDVPDPADGLREPALPRTAVLGDYMLLCGLEHMKLGEREGPVKSMYALRLADGEAFRHWLPVPNCHFSTDWGVISRRGEKLFILWGAEFAEVKLEDIEAKKNGWASVK